MYAEVSEEFPSATIPLGLTKEEQKLVQHVCGVLTLFKLATRVVENSQEQGLASCYLPHFMGLKRNVQDKRTPKPKGPLRR